jgi:predicted nicotinamide N-methyase
MKSAHGYIYKTKEIEVLDFNFTTIRDLDESIDVLCNFFGEDEEDNSLAEQYCPYFGVLWEAGIGLGQFLSTYDVKNKSVLEIGCGLALPSFVVTRAGGNIIATDFHADVPLFLSVNQTKNNLPFNYRVMNWRDEIERTKTDLGTFDLVIGSDILYESQHPKEVASALIAFLKPGGKIILADPGRAYIQQFVTAMKELGYKENFTTQTIRAELCQRNKTRDIFIFEFLR